MSNIVVRLRPAPPSTPAPGARCADARQVHACEPWGSRWPCALPALEVASFRVSRPWLLGGSAKKDQVEVMPMIRACGTSKWHLPFACDRGTIKSDSRRHPQATRRQRGRAVTRGLPIRDRWPASVTASRRLTKEDRHFTALTGDRQLYAKAHAPTPRCRGGRRSHGLRTIAYRKTPRKYRWTGAATPAQQNTTRPQEPPRRASDNA